MSYLSWHYGVPKGSKTGAHLSTCRRAAAPTYVGRVSLRAVPSLKLGFGHMSTARQRQSKSDIHGQGGAAPAWQRKSGGRAALTAAR